MKLSFIALFKRNTALVFAFSFLTILSAEGFATEAKFDGYIIKLKKDHKFMSKNSLQGMGAVTDLELSFGDFFYVDSANSFKKLDLEAIKNNPDVEYIEPNYLYHHEALDLDSLLAQQQMSGVDIKDPTFKSQWALQNTGHNTWIKDSPPGLDINAVKAWEISKNGSDVIVAIIDSGINYNHPDLIKNLWFNEAEKNGLPGFDDDGNGFIDDINGYDFANNDGDPMDEIGHGTHVAGIIGATHNAEGIRGVMPNVKIMALKFLNETGKGDTKNAVRAVDYAMRSGAKIINNSWGGGSYSQTLFDAFMAAAAQNIIITAAAGNNKNDNDLNPSYPASYKVPNLISVAANNALDEKASFSSFGLNSINVYAPGVFIVSTDIKPEYQWRSGTSMATPIVTGALGLLLSMEPGISFADAKKRIMETSIKNPELLKYAQAGRIDIYRMLMNQRN